MKTLAIFDFDDTLFTSSSKIVVTSHDGSVLYLSTREFSTFVPAKGDKVDFREFKNYPTRPKPVKKTVQRMLKCISLFGLNNVMILTARGSSEPVSRVLVNFGLPAVFVAAINSTNPDAKASFVKMAIVSQGYERVILYEDNIDNIQRIKSVVGEIIPPDMCECYRVIAGGTNSEIFRIR